MGYADQMNLYGYCANDPVNSVDPTGQCKNDPNCSGNFSKTSQTASPNQSGAGLQDYFNFGTGEQTYVADPKVFQMDAAIDIGTIIQNAVNQTGTTSSKAYAEAVANGGSAPFGPVDVRFNGERNSFMKQGNPSGKSIGRFIGVVSGRMNVAADGSCTVNGSITFKDNDYSWAADSSGLANMVINEVGRGTRVASPGSLNARDLSINNYPGTPVATHSGLVKVIRGVGNPVPMGFNRTYNFTAWGQK